VNDLICTEMRMDLSADQIAQSVHFGDPTMPPFIVRGRVVNQLGDEGWYRQPSDGGLAGTSGTGNDRRLTPINRQT
jgi:hypothetical protein